MRSSFSYPLGRILRIYLIWWVLWAFVQVMVLHRMGLDWPTAVTDSAISNGLLALACAIAVILYRFYQPGKGNRFYLFVFAISITLLFCQAFKWTMMYLFPQQAAFVEASMPLRFIFSLLILSFITVFNWMLSSMQERNQQDIREKEAQQLVKEAELVKLRQQLQPHFLFNSLNSISALAGSKPNEARKMIQQLSDFLRGTLRKDEKQTVSLKEELAHLELYLEIEKVRFGHRLAVEIEAPEEATRLQLPALLLQPIVENAIKFGLYGTVDDVTVSLRAWQEQQNLLVEVRNPFDQDTQSQSQGTGFGLSSVQRRLYLLYGRNDLLQTEKKDQLFITKLKIPQLITELSDKSGHNTSL